ncbi:unnamed protein product [Leptosia nina]|uniref:Uncharacterized protein n=2 Tax=Leptosia nina TaxID=320188 RepID=A0AAV1K0P1_9NEOP
MIGRADIEGSKSNVAMNAWPPQASYPCVPMRTEHLDQASFCPFALREVSVLAELALGHLRYSLTDVPPQSNSPPGSVLEPDHAGVERRRARERHATTLHAWNETPYASRLRKSTAHRFRPTELESSSTGSSFPADSPKPVPLAVVSLDSNVIVATKVP